MVAIKNVFFAASCVASALAAPATKRQDWGNGGQVGGWDQSQGQGQGQDAGASTGSGEVASVPITNEGQGQSTGSGEVASVPITNEGQGQSTGASTGSAAGNSSSSTDSTAGDSSAGSSNLAAVDGQTLTSSESGQSGDYYYSHWVENNSGASMTVGSGSYSLEWTEASGNIVSGIGWNPASAR